MSQLVSNFEQPAFRGLLDTASISLPQGRESSRTRSEWAWCDRNGNPMNAMTPRFAPIHRELARSWDAVRRSRLHCRAEFLGLCEKINHLGFTSR